MQGDFGNVSDRRESNVSVAVAGKEVPQKFFTPTENQPHLKINRKV